MEQFIELITNLGFPVACVIALGYFVYRIYLNSTADSKAREEKLYNEIAENRKINAEAIKTIALYAEKLDTIQRDVNEIKQDIVIITDKVS